MRSDRALSRVVFSGLLRSERDDRVNDARAIFTATKGLCLDQGISGQLVFINGYYLGLADGSPRSANALLSQIQADERLDSNTLLLHARGSRPGFQGWSGAYVDRMEPEWQTAGRLARLQQRLISDPRVQAVDYFRLLSSPSPSGFEPSAGEVRAATKRILFSGPSALWGATALQKIAAKASVPAGRMTIEELVAPYKKTLVEYVDLVDPVRGPMRLTYTNDGVHCAGAYSLLDGVDVLVLFALSSDLDQLPTVISQWLSSPSVKASRPEVFIASSLSPDRIANTIQVVQAISGVNITCVKVGLNDAGGVLQQVLEQLDARFSSEGLSVMLKPQRSDWMPADFIDEPPEQALEQDPLPSAAKVEQLLGQVRFKERLSQVEGLVQAVALQAAPASVLSSWGDEEGQRAASLADADLLGLMVKLLQGLCPGDPLEDIMLTTSAHIQLFRLLPFGEALWLVVTLDRQRTTAGAARLLLGEMASELADACV